MEGSGSSARGVNGSRRRLVISVAATVTCVCLSLAVFAQASHAATVDRYPLPLEGGSPRPQPLDIVGAPDGGAWFSEGETASGTIGYLSAGGALTQYAEPANVVDSFGVALSKDGSVWATGREFAGGETVWGTEMVTRRRPDGTFSTYRVPDPAPGQSPPVPFEGDITEGPDGAMWFTELEGEHVGRLTLSGEASYYPLPSTKATQFEIARGPDGALWFTQTNFFTGESAIGRITTSGQVTLFPIAGNYPFGITAGPDGAMWFTEPEAHKIGRITMAGALTYYDTPESNTWPTGITSDNGVLWFANENQETLGSITTAGKVAIKPLGTFGQRPQDWMPP
jgi:virginiamycin B lyase